MFYLSLFEIPSKLENWSTMNTPTIIESLGSGITLEVVVHSVLGKQQKFKKSSNDNVTGYDKSTG